VRGGGAEGWRRIARRKGRRRGGCVGREGRDASRSRSSLFFFDSRSWSPGWIRAKGHKGHSTYCYVC
jgi:hypothetical protein